MKTLGIATLAVGITIGLAPPAAASEDSYLAKVQDRLAYLSRDQLLTEAYKVCQMTLSGHATPAAIPVVTKDLAITVPAAVEIITAAVTEFGC
jgi:hypothetical protein